MLLLTATNDIRDRQYVRANFARLASITYWAVPFVCAIGAVAATTDIASAQTQSAAPGPPDSGKILITLLLCGLMGLLGQGVRAAVGLKNSMGLGQSGATQQASFNAAYFGLSLMIGFIAGVLAGLAIGLSNLFNIDVGNLKILLGIAAAGYAGADFIENTFSIIIPNANENAPQASKVGVPAAPDISGVQALLVHAQALNNSVAALTSVVGGLPPASLPSFGGALHGVAPGVNTQVWVPALTTGFTQFGISTNKRVAAAIGQFLVEAGENFKEVVENLTYTHAS